MKTNKTETATYTFNFSPVEKLMLTAQAAEVKLSDALSLIWNATPIEFRVVTKFREQFTAFAKARKYGETWIKRTLAANCELRVRKTSKTMSETKKANAAKKKAAAAKTPAVAKFTVEQIETKLKALATIGTLDSKTVKAILKAFAI